MADADKHLEKAEKLLAKNKLDGALTEYKAAYEATPGDLAVLQQIADLCTKLDRGDEAMQYYAEIFDRAVQKNDTSRAAMTYTSRLQNTPQPPERQARYAELLVKQKKNPEAVQAYNAAADAYEKAGNAEGILQCLERLAQLEPDNADVHIRLGEQADKMGKAELAAKGLLRGGQLVRPDDADKALGFLQRAHKLNPDRSTALNLAEVQVEKGQSGPVIELLTPIYQGEEKDPGVMQTLGRALIKENKLDMADEVLTALHAAEPTALDLFFDLADRHFAQGNGDKATQVLSRLKTMYARAKREPEYGERLEKFYEGNKTNLDLGQLVATYFSESNQESRYEKILGSLFEAYLGADRADDAAHVLDQLIDIDAYDFMNQDRLKQLKGKLNNKRYRDIALRISADPDAADDSGTQGGGETEPQALDDVIVQVELFIQYNLRSKAIEKLQQLAKDYPDAVANNERVRGLYGLAEIKPPDVPPAAAESEQAAESAATAAETPTAPAPQASRETVSDLAKISEITHSIYRKGSPKEILHTAVTELGKYLRTSRALGVVGKPGAPPQIAVEYCSPGVPQSPSAVVKKLLDEIHKLDLNRDTGAVSNANLVPALAKCGAQSVLAMPLIDTEKMEEEGVLALSQADSPRQWNPNEVYLVKAVADQAQAAISHTKLRSLMANLSVTETGGGLLGRSVYLDTVVAVVERAKKQGTPLVIALFEMDMGRTITRQLGEPAVDAALEKAGELLLAQVRQNDMAFRYTATSLAVLLGDTTMQKCRKTIDKIRRMLCTVKMDGADGTVTFCAGACEASIRPDHESVDIVIDVVNRAEDLLSTAREKGNSVAA